MSFANKRNTKSLAFIIIVAFMLGMMLNSFIQNKLKENGVAFSSSDNKLNRILSMIESNYVDSLSTTELIEQAIPTLLKELDPHTVYIPAKNLQKINDELKGNFGGIGVQFIRYLDTVAVVRVIPNGPSELAGLKAGDRIIAVNDSSIVGKSLTDQEIMSHLKGPKGTSVMLKIFRKGQQKNREVEILRGSIPMPSVDVAYMINNTLGYIKVSRFASTTYFEFLEGLEKLKSEGLQKLIVDLRGNAGGYLSEATNMLNEFLEKGELIVYTLGKSREKIEYKADGSGQYKTLPIMVLIDEGSASASEIFAGAIQDNDRGKIIGRRSFGKGLVQEQSMLPDGSALRLTVARYYTPTGRCIQKPYEKGKEEYDNELYFRLIHGELQKKDSIHFDESLKYTTPKGNTVYGGGGIMPDVFIPADTTGYSDYFKTLSLKGLIYRYAFYFVDSHRKEMLNLKTYEDILNYLKDKDLLKKLVAYATKHGVKPDSKGLNISEKLIETQLNAYIARDLIDDIGFYPIIRKIDQSLMKAETHFN